MLCWMRNLRMLSLSILYNNDELNNQAWMRDWHSLSWLWLECPVNNTGLVDWLILVCWSSKEEVSIVVFHARRGSCMLSEYRYPCTPLIVDWIYEWIATFSTFNPVVSWLHFGRVYVGSTNISISTIPFCQLKYVRLHRLQAQFLPPMVAEEVIFSVTSVCECVCLLLCLCGHLFVVCSINNNFDIPGAVKIWIRIII